LKRLAIAVCALPVLSGCASALVGAGTMAGVVGGAAVGSSVGGRVADKRQRQQATAEAIGPEVDWFTVKVSGVSKRGQMFLWRAQAPSGRYDCSEQAGDTAAACTKLP
jgi:hypothetical protein